MSVESLGSYIEARRAEVDTALGGVLASPDCPDVLATAMRYSLLAGGKRLRPVLCLASAEAVGGDRRRALPVACAIELIHTYSLVHDDLPAMDDDTMRRGRPTLHVVAGEGMAILAGDGLLTEAFHLMAREPAGIDADLHARKLRAIAIVAAAAGAAGMVGGQAIDLASVAPGPGGGPPRPLAPAELEAMHRRKTGALIGASAEAGAVMGGGSDAQVRALGDAGRELGLAFQIVDDILDVEGASADLGKTAGKDAAAGKPTYPGLHGLQASRAMAADCFARAEATLAAVALSDSRLLAIGRWIVERSA